MNLTLRQGATLAVLCFAGSSFAQTTINLATGQDASGNIQTDGTLPDANWQISNGTYWWNGTTDVAGGSGNAWTVAPGQSDWYGGWFGNGPNSSWICSDPNANNNGNLIATYTFNLTADQVASATFAGWQAAIDDQGTVVLNGNTVASIGDGAWGSFTGINVTGLQSDLVVGTNTLVLNDFSDFTYEAERFEGTIIVNSTPEPFAPALLGATGLGLVEPPQTRLRA